MLYIAIDEDYTVRELIGRPRRDERDRVEEGYGALLRIDPRKGEVEKYLGDGEWEIVTTWPALTTGRQRKPQANPPETPES